MVKVQRLFAKTNLKIPVFRTDKIPLGTKGRTSILSVESSASCGASFPVSREKLPDRECCVTLFRQGGYTPLPLKRLSPVYLPSANSIKCCSPPASFINCINIYQSNGEQERVIYVNYPSPKGNGLVTAQSY